MWKQEGAAPSWKDTPAKSPMLYIHQKVTISFLAAATGQCEYGMFNQEFAAKH
jgi:hypothetical protein